MSRGLRNLFIALVLVMAATMSVQAQTIVVDSQVVDGDCGDGTCSLSDAIDLSNALDGKDTIAFNLSTAKTYHPHVILSLTQALPDIVTPVIIDGTTPPGYAGIPLVMIEPHSSVNAANGFDGMRLLAGNSTIKGLAFGGFSNGDVVGLRVLDGGRNLIEDNHFGFFYLAWKGGSEKYQVHANNAGILMRDTSQNLVRNNVVSGNLVSGVELHGDRAYGNKFLGNIIGLDPTGNYVLENSEQEIGLAIVGAYSNEIGGVNNGDGNLLSGNYGENLTLQGPTARFNLVKGNIIGTDRSGTKYVFDTFSPNLEPTGIAINFGASHNVIGGARTQEANLISGNHMGIEISHKGTSNNRIYGNMIGPDITGKTAIKASINNFYQNVQRIGVSISGGSRNVVGSEYGKKNIISGHLSHGVYIYFHAHDNYVRSNIIGLTADGKKKLANGGAGVVIEQANNKVIGGGKMAHKNTIVSNGGAGVAVLKAKNGESPALFNKIWLNDIYANGGLAIDLDAIDIASSDFSDNDANLDSDFGANELQNFPYNMVATTNGDTLYVYAELDSKPDERYEVHFYVGGSAGTAKYSGGKFVGLVDVQTDENGYAEVIAQIDTPTFVDSYLFATVTDSLGNTSEFSKSAKIGEAFEVDNN